MLTYCTTGAGPLVWTFKQGMTSSTKLRFLLAVVFATLASVSLFMHVAVATSLFSGVAWLLLDGFAPLLRPIPSRELLIVLLVVGAFLALALSAPFLQLHADQPSRVARAIASTLLWLFWLWAISRRWQKTKGANV